MSTYYSMITPTSYGKITLMPFACDPIVRYQLNEIDIELLKTALVKLAHVLFAAGAVKLFPSVVDEGFIMDRGDDIEEKLSRLEREDLILMTIHLFSSCPAGDNRVLCVADKFGQVYNQEGLYINDSSMLCSATSVNPQGTIMALARRNILNFIREKKEK